MSLCGLSNLSLVYCTSEQKHQQKGKNNSQLMMEKTFMMTQQTRPPPPPQKTSSLEGAEMGRNKRTEKVQPTKL